MYCPECGAKIKDEARFCPECGAEITHRIHEDIPDQAEKPSAPKKKRHPLRVIIPVAIVAIAAVCILYVIPEKTDVRITKQGIAKVEPILNSKGKKVGHLVKDDGYMKTYQINSTDAEGLVIYKDDKFSVTVGSAQSVIVKNTTSDNKQILFKTASSSL